jgi:hypothetical protein
MKPSLNELADAIRGVYAADPSGAGEAIEKFLSAELAGMDPAGRLEVLDRLGRVFPAEGPHRSEGSGGGLMDRLVPLLLGRDISAASLSNEELVDRLSASLNTVFTTLNDLIRLINATLGGTPEHDETIRQIIGESIEGSSEAQTIEAYLGQIRKAFLAAQESSKEAARTMVGHILTELDPKAMDQGGGGFRIGPLKKAEGFDLFEERYKRVKKWFDSERFLLDFLRQFEKNCQKSFI